MIGSSRHRTVVWVVAFVALSGLVTCVTGSSSLKSGAIYSIHLQRGRSVCWEGKQYLGFANRTCGSISPKTVGPMIRTDRVSEMWRRWIVTILGTEGSHQYGTLETYYSYNARKTRCTGLVSLHNEESCKDRESKFTTIDNVGGPQTLWRFAPLDAEENTYRIISMSRKGGCRRFLRASSDCSHSSVLLSKTDYGTGLERWVFEELESANRPNDILAPSPPPLTAPALPPTGTEDPEGDFSSPEYPPYSTEQPPPETLPSRPQSASCVSATTNTQWSRYVYVYTTAQIQNAFNIALAGDVIEIAPGTYSPELPNGDRLTLQNRQGSYDQPIIVCGPPTVEINAHGTDDSRSSNVLEGHNVRMLDEPTKYSGIVLRGVVNVLIHGLAIRNTEIGVTLSETVNTTITGMRISRIENTGIAGYRLLNTNIQKSEISESHRGVILDFSTHCTLSHLRIYNTGNSALKLRRNSTYNTITDCYITDTGKVNRGYGEGIYIGSSSSNSYYNINGTYTFLPDRSDFNTITNNVIGPRVTADMIDIKPLTKGGKIINNTFDGSDISGWTGADSWVASNGNEYIFKDNTGRNLPAFGEGFQNRVETSNEDIPDEGTGFRNIYENNFCDMTGADTSHYCLRLTRASVINHGNVIYCSNTVKEPHRLSNVPCQKGATVASSTSPKETEAERTAIREAYLEEERMEAGRDDPPPRGWLDIVFPETQKE